MQTISPTPPARMLFLFALLIALSVCSAGRAAAQTLLATVTTGTTPAGVAVDSATGVVYTANSGSGTVTVFNPHTQTSSSITVGTAPTAIAANPAASRIYVANKGGNSVSFINASTNAVTATVSVGTSPVAIGVDAVTDRIYVVNYGGSTVSVLNGTSGALIATLSVGSGPVAVAVDSVTNFIYVANQLANTVSVINGATHTVSETITVGSAPSAIALNAVTNVIFVANFSANTVTVISGSSNAVLSTPSTGSYPIAIAVNPVSNQVYAVNYYGSSVTQIDGTSYSTSTIAVGSGPKGIALNSGTNQIYVANTSAGTLSVIDGASATVTATVTTGSGPEGIAVSTADNKVFVSDTTANELTEIDGAAYPQISVLTGTASNNTAGFPAVTNPVTNMTYIANIGIPSEAYTDPAPPVNGYYTATYYDGTVTVINGNTGAVVATLPLGGALPLAAAINPANNKIYVTNYFIDDTDNSYETGYLTIIDGSTNTVKANINIGQLPNAVAVNPVTGNVYVADIGSGNPSVPFPQCITTDPPNPANCIIFGTTPGNVVVVSGTTDEIIGSPIQVGIEPGGFAINQVTNKVYVYNFFSDTISAINGSTNTLTATIDVGHLPDGIDVNPKTNKIYVANSNYCADSGYTPGLTIIDGSTNSVLVANLALDPSTPTPWAVVADPISDKVYISNANESNALNCVNPDHDIPPLPGSSTITVVDGSSNSVIHTLSAPSGVTWTGTDWGVFNPAKNKLYFSNAVSANVTVIDAATDQTSTIEVPNLPACTGSNYTSRLCQNEGGLVVVNPATSVAYVGETGCCDDGIYLDIIPESSYAIVPLLSTIAPVVDSHTISSSPVFITSNTTPSFTFSVDSTYSTYSPYTSLDVTNPPPTALYYSVDTLETTMKSATITSTAGANPASFSATLPTLTVGSHILYVYATYGREGSAETEANNGSSAPEIGNLATAYFVVAP